MNLQEYARKLASAEEDFERSISSAGVEFEETESSPRRLRTETAELAGCHCENAGYSIWRNWISPACIACRCGIGTGSLFVDLRCTKSCYFCFNVNQPYYNWHLTHERDIVRELEQAHAGGADYRFLAVTGGEPLLHKEQVYAFLKRANELYPGLHTRLYTNGDLLDPPTAQALAKAGLKEVRLSVKPPEEDKFSEMAYRAVANAVATIPDVVIEVPAIPGSLEQMKELMRRADSLGVRGINLLEFCFPKHNAGAFVERGFKMRKRPYRYLYDYRYDGGVPVAGSEREALELVRFAAAELPGLGVHYCSIDNRASTQVSLQNRAFSTVKGLKEAYPWMTRDGDGPFLACAKAVGEDAGAVAQWAQDAGVPLYRNEAAQTVSLPLSCIDALHAALPDAALGKSINVLEKGENEGEYYMVEVGIEKL